MTIVAARALSSSDVCFVGIGAPSAACNLARLTHAPGITLIYESGTIATKPNVLPLSIGDGELCETALTTVSVPEMFRYWLQGGRITVGFLGGAQIDRFANLNTTVVGALRQAQGAAARRRRRARDRHLLRARSSSPWRRASARSSTSSISSPRSATATGRGYREKLGVKTKGPTRVITDLCVMEPDPETKELTVVGHASRRDARADRRRHRLARQVRRQGGRERRRRPRRSSPSCAICTPERRPPSGKRDDRP